MKDLNHPTTSARKRNIVLITCAAFVVLLCAAYYFVVIYPANRANREYAEQLASSWISMESSMPESLPVFDPVPPTGEDAELISADQALTGIADVTRDGNKDRASQSPSAIERLQFNAARLSNSVVRTVKASVEYNNDYERSGQLSFYGTTCTFHYPSQRFVLYGLSDEDLSAKWRELSGGRYDNLLYDCLNIKAQLQLCDWAYLQLLNQISERICGIGNEATFLQAYLYAQSGYKMRLATSTDYRTLYLLFAAYHNLSERIFFSMDDGNYYFFANSGHGSYHICTASFGRGNKYMSLAITANQRFASKPVKSRKKIIIDKQEVTLYVNENLLNFYTDYPRGYYNNVEDYCKLYAEPSIDDDVRRQVYPYLRQAIADMTETDAANYLLHWVQTHFDYKTDGEAWGYERAFFPTETLYYPYCDCEDRSILYSRLMRDLVGSDVILLHVPNHMATGVHFKQDESVYGSYLEIEGNRYYICDPTIMGVGAPIGTAMKCMQSQPITYIKI